MNNDKHLRVLRRGVDFWNQWRQDNPTARPHFAPPIDMPTDLRNADFHDAELDSVWFDGRDLREANFKGAHVVGCTFNGADLTGVDLSELTFSFSRLTAQVGTFDGATLREANLKMANLGYCSLKGADLTRANLSHANFDFADLTFANFTGATLEFTSLAAADLRGAKGFESCRYEGPRPCTIDHTTLQEAGNLPSALLRACHIPDRLAEFLPSLLDDPIQFYSCFISYSHNDQEFASKLHEDLQHKGIRCWFAPHKMQGGKKLHAQIDQAIRFYDRLVLILSDHSMKSEWVKTEIANARQREKREQRQVLFPISIVPFTTNQAWRCFDADIGSDSAREIREYFISDFTNWKDGNSYEDAFQNLLRDLKAKGVAFDSDSEST